MRLARITTAVLSALVLAGFVQGCQTPAKSDCDIASGMMDYRKKTGDEVSSVKNNIDNMDDPNGFILGKYDAWLVDTQKDVDSMKDQNIKGASQKIVDSDKEFIAIHRGMIQNPPDFSDTAWQSRNNEKLKAALDHMGKATEDLRQLCPNVKAY